MGRDTPALRPVAPCFLPAEGTVFLSGEHLAAVCLIPKECVSTELGLRRGVWHVEEEAIFYDAMGVGSRSCDIATGDSLHSLREDTLETFVAELGRAHN